MPFKSTKLYVAAGLLGVFLVSQAFGQGPLGFQLFAPADLSTYGGGQPPNQGYFFQYDALYWSTQSPKTQAVGLASASDDGVKVYNGAKEADSWFEKNTLDTSDFQSKFVVGSRFEFGRMEDRNGWMVSILQTRNQGQYFKYDSANIVFEDTAYGDDQYYLQGAIPVNPSWTVGGSVSLLNLPTTFHNIEIYNQVSVWGVEASYIRQTLECHSGGVFEFFGGARYLEFNELYSVHTGADASTGKVPDFLSNSYWDTNADNHIVGPQVGARFFKKQGRWMISTEGRFTAGLNCQNFNQQYSLGPNLSPYGSVPTTASQLYTPCNLGPQAGTHDAYARVFTPLVELRVEARYQLTRSLSFHAGWTGIWMDNIARANAMVDYNIEGLGINMANNKQDVFINGLTLGFDINR